MIGIEAAIQGVSGDLPQFFRIPAIASEHGHFNAKLAGLNRNVADVCVIARNENHVGVARANCRELGREIGIPFLIGLLGNDFATLLCERRCEIFLQADGVRLSLVEQDGRLGRLQSLVLARELRAHVALERIDETHAKDHVALLGNFRIRGRGRDHRDLIFLTNGSSDERQARRHFTEHGDDLILRNQPRYRRSGLGFFAFVVVGDDANLLTMDAAGLIDLIDGKVDPVIR